MRTNRQWLEHNLEVPNASLPSIWKIGNREAGITNRHCCSRAKSGLRKTSTSVVRWWYLPKRTWKRGLNSQKPMALLWKTGKLGARLIARLYECRRKERRLSLITTAQLWKSIISREVVISLLVEAARTWIELVQHDQMSRQVQSALVASRTLLGHLQLQECLYLSSHTIQTRSRRYTTILTWSTSWTQRLPKEKLPQSLKSRSTM